MHVRQGGAARKMCRTRQLGTAASYASFDTGMPSHPLSTHLHLFLFFLPLFKPRPAACRASFAMGMPFPSPSPIHPSPPFLTRSKEVSGVTVSTACRLSVPPIPSPQNTKSSAFPEPTATVPHSLLFIWEGRHPLIFGISGHYEISLTPKPWSKLFRKHLSSLPSGDSVLDDCRLFRSGSGLEWR